ALPIYSSILLTYHKPNMKKTYSYKDCFQILDITPDCSWAELRKSYKKLIQKWHPDRFKDNSKEKAGADNKIKTINIAFKQISSYYRSNGSLPPIEEKPKTKQQVPPKKPSIKPVTTKTTVNKQFKPEPEKTSNRSFVMAILILLILCSAYYLLADEFYFEEPQFEEPQVLLKNNKKTTHFNNVSTTIDQSTGQTPASNNHLEDKLKLTSYEESILQDTLSADEDLLIDDTYFTNGSSIAEVIDIMGVPSRIDGDTWFYGESEIHFNGGEVIYWVRDTKTPLKARMIFNKE
ncbi:MAG: J domain-containing protein, partial [Methylococcales bacterium]